MPLVVAWFGRMLLTSVGEFAVRALMGLGVGFATHEALSSSAARGAMVGYLQAAGPLWAWVGALGIDTAMTILLSAWAGRMGTNAAKAFVVKRAS